MESDKKLLRLKKLKIFNKIAFFLESHRKDIIQNLREIESLETAKDELDKSIRMLKTYDQEIKDIEDRKSFGVVAVSLPFNNPLYSFILYCFGPCLGGSHILVRPSKITKSVLLEIIKEFKSDLNDLSIKIVDMPGKEFIEKIQKDPNIKTLIFTGSWDNLIRLRSTFPENKKLIYCGSGLNPFIITEDALNTMKIENVVRLAIESKVYNSGQDCLCTERFYVHHSVANLFINLLTKEILKIKVGKMNDDTAIVTPLLGDGAKKLANIAEQQKNGVWHIPFRQKNDLAFPSFIEVAIDDPLLNTEKYGPMFVVARYYNDETLDIELNSKYCFGVTVCGTFVSKTLSCYPHITTGKTVILTESESLHVPFGGKKRSGFVLQDGIVKDGPILYSLETTK